MNLAPRDKLEELSLYSESREKLLVEKIPSTTVLKDQNANYKLGAIKDKGMGLIASRDIKKGELILAEDPVFKYEKTCSGSKERDCRELGIIMKQLLNVYRSNFQKLPSHVQEDVLALYSNPTIQDRVARCLKIYLPDVSQKEIFIKFVSNCLTNSFSTDKFSFNNMVDGKEIPPGKNIEESFEKKRGSDQVVSRQGMYMMSARFNHSCMPNVQWYFKGNTIKFRAASPITNGDELCIFYEVPLSLTKHNTMKVIRSNISYFLGFDCICKLCATKDKRMQKEVESHRVKFWQLQKEHMQKIGEMEPESNPVSRVEDILRLGKEIFSEQQLGYVAGLQIAQKSKGLADICYALAKECKNVEMEEYFFKKSTGSYFVYGIER